MSLESPHLDAQLLAEIRRRAQSTRSTQEAGRCVVSALIDAQINVALVTLDEFKLAVTEAITAHREFSAASPGSRPEAA